MSDERRKAGRAIRAYAQGAKTDKLGEALQALDPELRDYADEFIFGSIWARAGLERDERMLIVIALLSALGRAAQLRAYLHGALQAGIAPERVREALMMVSVYAGFPAAIDGLEVWRQVRESHARRG